MIDTKKLLFPHKKVRESQNELIKKIDSMIKLGKNLVVHAPTGLGKTAAAIGPALSYALKNDKTVFFLTSRHTQHKIAIDTLKKIKEKFNIDINIIDLIGKKWMCPVSGVEKLYSSEFSEYCKNAKENNMCEFFLNTKDKQKLTVKSKSMLKQIKTIMPIDSQKLYELCVSEKLCPNEISQILAKNAKVIVADYYYIFNSNIRETLFAKSEKLLEDCIIIVDEGHNLPSRVKDLASQRLTNIILKRAIKEAKKYQLDDIVSVLAIIQDALLDFSKGLKSGEEKIVSKEDFILKITKHFDYDSLISQAELAAINIRKEQKQSYLGSISAFLESWVGQELGFARIFSLKKGKHEDTLLLSYQCLDPSIITSDVINETHSTIIMSGTLTPTHMYKELLGIENVEEEIFGSPFPDKNKLNLIVTGATTKFTSRNEEQFKKIAEISANIVNSVKGNCVLFFPSYFLLQKVSYYFDNLCNKTTIKEMAMMTKDEKSGILEKFIEYEKTGAVLLGAISGSFGEGIDLPGNLLNCVVIVGLPLTQPNLETKSLIEYYDKKFSKGWDYGYTAPALNKTLQCAGRCIRSETDKGVVVFLDDRYTWNNYFKYFPKDWKMKITKTPEENINEFYGVTIK